MPNSIDNRKNKEFIIEPEIFIPSQIDKNSAIFKTGNLKIKELSIDLKNNFEDKEDEKDKYYTKSTFYKWKYPIKLINYRPKYFNSDTSPYYHRDWILIRNERFYFDSLYYNRNITDSLDPIRAEISGIFEIETITKKIYLALFAKNYFYNTTYSDEILFLFDVTNENITIPLCLGYTKCISIMTFGSYTNNGFLNLVKIQKSSKTYNKGNIDTVFTYQINNERIEKIESKFILIKDLEGIGESYYIMDKSKWWY